ncbi:3,4-dihydroxyphenylacetate 2,3-dioxygenase [Azospirillum sp. RWY-5-1]|uniref:3,4-dihydroxyphenylacetate 2,3-dioxygenase n=1 Tax=Azospirillum oleiclasticum TaxID=2735135 RepID=A0ABX2TFS9_9PROT|nr:VOC family protein [Azospirillum oleiclasticum]NYZ15592.1 3,4-dihydroxyphenylacetate 2,3-dioxygenase [Azospirillum oleiclasticum]NYZ22615.1 3,4-dihydroxyphenylacetate 2,3-dioxygenase [Azospirillum oleiclasticum]
MPVPVTNFDPPFNITRASHIVLTARDLEASKTFYTEVIGLVVTAEDSNTVYLRGLEESCHHSLVLVRSDGKPLCQRVGLRVFSDDDLDRAKEHFDGTGREAVWVDRPHQGRTLHVSDPLGMPLEFVASMPVQRRLHDQVQLHKGGGALRFDHFQFLAPEVGSAARFYTDLGFRISDYATDKPEDDQPLAIFLYRKNNPHDIVFLTRPGPKMHHFAYIVTDTTCLFRALDTAGNTGFKTSIERGPARHGQGHSFYVYFRDPDGHRVEILPPPIQILDLDDGPVHWHTANRQSWEMPPPKSWLFEATEFDGATVKPSDIPLTLISLEEFLARKG